MADIQLLHRADVYLAEKASSFLFSENCMLGAVWRTESASSPWAMGLWAFSQGLRHVGAHFLTSPVLFWSTKGAFADLLFFFYFNSNEDAVSPGVVVVLVFPE